MFNNIVVLGQGDICPLSSSTSQRDAMGAQQEQDEEQKDDYT
jgi:hypothetical protein